MEFASRPRRPVRENVVPLINVVFLLLIFFMLTATLRPAEPVEVMLPSAEASTPRDEDERPVLALDDAGRLALDGRMVDLAALSALPMETGPRLELRADARVPARVLLPVLEALGRAGVTDVEVVTRAR